MHLDSLSGANALMEDGDYICPSPLCTFHWIRVKTNQDLNGLDLKVLPTIFCMFVPILCYKSKNSLIEEKRKHKTQESLQWFFLILS